jgi:zinc protease
MIRVVPALLLVFSLLLPQPVWASSASAGLDPDRNDGASLPLGRLPERDRPSSSAPVPAPAFRLTPPSAPEVTDAGVFKPETFTLPNGLAVVVVPNHRAPIISHMVWYQVGSADEPEGKSGLAHLLEHLMFKGTLTVPDGVFSRTIAANGGNDNAFTSWDYTAYFQNIAKDRLELVMQMEADRMTSLALTDDQVKSEKEVVLAERQQNTENEPITRLGEAIRTAQFVHHPYGRPIIGWPEEIGTLTREDVLAFYRTWYSPANAIVVISGDVTAEEVRPLAEKTYGTLAARPVPLRNRLHEPQIDAERRVTLRDAGISQPVLMRGWMAPSWRSGDRAQVVPLQVLAEVLGGGPTSRLYRRLVMDLRLATSVDFDYNPMALDRSTVSLSLGPAPGRDTNIVEMALEAVLKDLLSNGISEAELNRARKRLVDGAVFARDSVQGPAYLFGMTLATGGDVSDIEEWPKRVMAVTNEEVMAAARTLFSQKGFVAGELEPELSISAPAAGTPEPLQPAQGVQ